MGRLILRSSGGAGGGGATGITFDSGWSGTGDFSAAGNAVTITRAAGGLGARSDERPIRWVSCDADNTSDVTYSRLTTGLPGYQLNAGWQSTIKPTGASGALIQTFPVNGEEPNWFDDGYLADLGTGKKAWAYEIYTDFDHSVVNNKTSRLWATTLPSETSVLLADADGFASSIDVDGDSPIGINVGSFVAHTSANNWYQYEMMFEDSSTDVSNGTAQGWINSYKCLADATAIGGYPTRISGQLCDQIKRYLFLAQHSNPGVSGPSAGAKSYLHGFWASDSWCYAYISSEATEETTVLSGVPTPPTSPRRAYQLFQSSGSSDTTYALVLRDSFWTGARSGKYLWVRTSAGTRMRVGTLS